jgi:hypothetical protein
VSYENKTVAWDAAFVNATFGRVANSTIRLRFGGHIGTATIAGGYSDIALLSRGASIRLYISGAGSTPQSKPPPMLPVRRAVSNCDGSALG